MKKKSGFTILELAVTVIIIAVIAVVALPMYKHAILKSRFSTVMPMAKAVADAQEVYYLGNNQYALGKEDLDIAPVEAENTQVSLSPAEEDEEYIYVAAHRTDIPNVRYIMYQKNSPKFASNIHCEADAKDDDALWLCEKALHGTEVTGSLQGKQYKTFLLAGELGGSSFKVCPENAVCNDEGNVTGCESGYYQEEQTCKQEKACDSAQEFIRTSCEEDCGEEVKQGTCNVKTGQWENYVVTKACPVKPSLTKACSELGKGWTSGTAQGTTQCSGGSWAEPTWDEEPCQKGCDSTKEYIRTTCDENCGEEIKQGTCNTKTGEWENYTVTQACPVKPAETQNCGEDYSNSSATATHPVTCSASNGSATWAEGEWDYTACGCTMSTKPADYTNACTYGYNGKQTYTYVCNSSNKWVSQVKSSNCTKVSYGGTFQSGSYCWSSSDGYRCSGYTFASGSRCQADSSDACAGTFKSGSYCISTVVGACGAPGTVYEKGAYCTPAYGNSGARHCAAGTPTSTTGKCWDGSGGRVDC